MGVDLVRVDLEGRHRKTSVESSFFFRAVHQILDNTKSGCVG